MDIIHFAISNPVKVAVGVILTCLFGLLALLWIPVQLTPNVDEPRVTVTTLWPGKDPREIEREIIDRQEEKLKSIQGLRKMTSTAVESRATVELEFFIGTTKEDALQETIEKLNQVSGYPLEVERPSVEAADAAMSTPIAWLMFRAKDGRDVSTMRDFVWEQVKPILERVDGVANIDVYGGREREVQVRIDPALLAARGLTLREVEQALRGENVTISAGTIAKGKREFTYRTVGRYESPDQVMNTVIAYRGGGPVYVRDVATVVETHMKETGFVRSRGQPVLALPVRRQTGTNVIEVMRGLKKQLAAVNHDLLEPRGFELIQAYDETVYIDSSVDLVRDNLVYGGVLTVLVLLFFLRSLVAAGVIAASIPISALGTFLAVAALGRSFNVVMIAGMAFAVGMVVDNAVVVLDNIYRHRQLGKSAREAAWIGGKEVWGAILGSTLTTVVVFLPVIFIREEAGQLFRDLSIAISAGVLISLVVAIIVIPPLTARVLGWKRIQVKEYNPGRIAQAVADLVVWVNRRWITRLVTIVIFALGSLVGSWLLMPPADYLPTGNRNMVFGFVITEPGLGPSAFRELAYDVESYLRPYWEAEPGSPEAAALPPVQLPVGGMGADGKATMVTVPAPLIDHFFFVNFQGQCFMGAIGKDPVVVKPLVPLLTQAVMSSKHAVGAIPIFFQTPLFQSGRSGGGIDVEVRGNEWEQVEQSASQLFAELMQSQMGSIQPEPANFDLARPEIRAIPDRVRAAEVGLSVRDLGFIVEAAVDGAYVGEYRQAGDEVDLVVKLESPGSSTIHKVRNVPVYTPIGGIVPLASVVDFIETGAPQQINHIEEMPGITLRLRPAQGTAIETVMTRIESEIVPKLRAEGRISPDVMIDLAGSADKLVQTRSAMFGKWTGLNWSSVVGLLQSRGFIALLITYLLMCALFESFIYPIPIMFTVPLAAVGGFAGLRVVHWLSVQDPVAPIQQLDVVTMLGFVILLGVVVNNAILIVHQSLNNMSYGMGPEEALHESIRTRMRPIFMTALTTVFGQLPLALMPGAGSELYRGLAGVMVGGLLIATIFTLVLVPVVFSIFLSLRTRLMRRMGREPISREAPTLEPSAPEPVAMYREP